MTKFYNILAKLLHFIILLLLIIVLATIYLVNPNDYKIQIANIVENATGHHFVINGDINLNFYPKISLSLGQISLHNTVNFDQNQVFISVNHSQIFINPIALFYNIIEIEAILLDGIEINLIRKQNGQTNWNNLINFLKKPKTRSNNNFSQNTQFFIKQLNLKNTQINWQDQLHHQNYKFSEINLKTSAILFEQPIKLLLTANFAVQNSLSIQGKLDLNTRIIWSPSQFILENPTIIAILQNKLLPQGQQRLFLNAKIIKLNRQQQMVKINKLVAKFMNLNLQGNLQFTSLFKQATMESSLKLAKFNLRKLLQLFGQKFPKTMNSKALTSLSITTQLHGNSSQLQLQLTANLDNNHLQADIDIENFKIPAITFNATINKLDLDYYKLSSKTTHKPLMAKDIIVPLKILRQLNLNGKIHIAQLKSSNFLLNNISFDLVSEKNGFKFLKQ